MNTNLSKIQRDLLYLTKGKYGVFNDFNARRMIATLLEPHWMISNKLCMEMEFQCRQLMAALMICQPTFLQNEYNLYAMLDAFAKSPEEGHRFLYGKLSMMQIFDRVEGTDNYTTLIELGPPDPTIPERLKDIPDRPEPERTH